MVRPALLLFVLLTGFILPVAAQSKLDSLRKALDDINDNRQRVDALNTLSSGWYDTDVNEGFKYATDAYNLAHTMRYESGEQLALILIGYRYTVSGEFDKALDYYHQASRAKSDSDLLTGYSFVLTANVFRSLAKFDSARFFYDKALSILTSFPNSPYLPYAYRSLARLNVTLWENAEAKLNLKKAMDICRAHGNLRGLADASFSMADVSRNLSALDSVNYYIESGCEIAQETQSDYLLILCYKSQGSFYFDQGEYLKALGVLFKAMEILKTIEHPQLLASIYMILGDVYQGLGQQDVALKYYFDALKIGERARGKYEMAELYSQIGWIYKDQLNFTLAASYMERSLVIRREINDEHGISNSYNVLGVLYYQEKKYPEALEALEKSLSIRQAIGHRAGVSACLFNMALVYEVLGQLDKALDYHFRALEIEEQIGNKRGIGISYNQIGHVYTKSRNFSQAATFLNRAARLSKELSARAFIMENRLFFSALYEASGDYRKALTFHKQYTQLSDSIYSESNAMKLAEMQALYQVEQKDQEIERLNQNKEFQNSQIQLQLSQIGQQRTIIISGLVGLFLVAFFAFKTYQYTFKMKRANSEILDQKEEIQMQSVGLIAANQTIAQINKDLEKKVEDRTSALRQAYKELDTFFYRSSHDFRRPLTTFLGLAEVANITVKDSYALELFGKVRETANNLDKMLVKLQSISDVGAQQLVYKEVFVKEIFENVMDGFSDLLEQKNIRHSISVDLKESFYSYPAMFKIIAENLVENAIFFSGNDEPFVRVQVNSNQTVGHLIVEISDNGHGIDSQYKELIFDMYFRGSERSKGNGLGLYIVKKAVEKLNGTISFRSTFGKGTTFQVTLPTQLGGTDVA